MTRIPVIIQPDLRVLVASLFLVIAGVLLGQPNHNEKEFELIGIHAYLRTTSDKDFLYVGIPRWYQLHPAGQDGVSFSQYRNYRWPHRCHAWSLCTMWTIKGIKGHVDIDWYEYRNP